MENKEEGECILYSDKKEKEELSYSTVAYESGVITHQLGLLWCGFEPWLGNFHKPWAGPKRNRKTGESYLPFLILHTYYPPKHLWLLQRIHIFQSTKYTPNIVLCRILRYSCHNIWKIKKKHVRNYVIQSS